MAAPSLSPPPSTSQPLVPNQDVTDSVLHLRHLTTALSAFHRHFDDLQSHLDSISSSLDTLSQCSNQTLISDQALVSKQTLISEQTLASEKTPILTQPQTSHPKRYLISKNSSINNPHKTLILEQCPPKKTVISDELEIVSLCKSMNGNSIRNYIISNLSESEKLVEDVPSALKLCPNPSKLVLDCVGQFYLLGKNEFKKPSVNKSRQASVIMLQFFLPMVSECNTDDLVREEAKIGAVAWRNRMMNESGIGKASEVDAKGLFLFIGCFGIPDEFKDDDVLDLLRVSNGKEISGLLRRSEILIKKMKEIIEAKQKKNVDVEALYISIIFNLEVRYSSCSILTSFLTRSAKDWKSAMKALQDSKPKQAMVSFRKQLDNLKSLMKCLEDLKIEPTALMRGWNPKRKMMKLELQIAELDKKQDTNRKEQQMETKRKESPDPLMKQDKDCEEGIETKKKADQTNSLNGTENGDQPSSSKIGRKKKKKQLRRMLYLEQQKGAELVKEGDEEDHKEKMETKRKPNKPEPKMQINKGIKRARLGHELEQQNGAALIGGPIPSSYNKLPISSPVLNRTGAVPVPVFGLSRPYQYGDALDYGLTRPYRYQDDLYSERIVGQCFGEPERFVGRSYVEPVSHGANGLSRSPLFSNPYMNYLKPLPVGRSSESNLYGFADAVLEREASGGSRPSYRY